MAGWGHSSTRLFLTPTLIASLIGSLLGSSARGDDRSAVKSFRIRAAAFAPIGKVFSLGEIAINGHASGGEQPIWNGDLVKVPEGAYARLAIEAVGKVELSQATEARLAVSFTRLDNETVTSGLILSLTRGAATVRLSEAASAYLEACETVFLASEGSSFRTEISAGRANVYVLRGKVDVESSPPTRTYEVEMYKYDSAKKVPTGSPLPRNKPIEKKSGDKEKLAAKSSYTDDGRGEVNATSNIVRAGLARRLATQVGQPPSGQNAGADRTIKFELDKPDAGTLVSDSGRGQTVTGRTNAQGYAFVTFEAGSKESSATFTVSDVTDARTPREMRKGWQTTIIVKRVGFFQKWRNRVILGAAAAAVITIIVKHRTKPLRQEPPPQIP